MVFFCSNQEVLTRKKKYKVAKENILINRRMSHMDTPVPLGASFERVFYLGKDAEKDQSLVIEKLSKDALLIFRVGAYLGICDIKGDVLLPANYSWIGSLREGIVAVRLKDNQLYTFDVNARKLQHLLCQDVRRDCSLVFSEGLAAFPIRRDKDTGTAWGYMDTTGKIVIDTKYVFTTNFFGGHACVRVKSDDGRRQFNVIINKAGKVISPPDLDIGLSNGPYTSVKDQAGKTGIVDMDFKYVIEPIYHTLSTQLAPESTVDEDLGPWSRRVTPALLYFATRSAGGPVLVLSPQGRVLFQLPKEVSLTNDIRRGLPIFHDGVIACNVGPDSKPNSKVIYFNLHGQEVPAPYSGLSTSPDITFREVAPGILLKRIDRKVPMESPFPFGPGNGGRLFKLSRETANNPVNMSLIDYISEPLRPAVAAFDLGDYRNSLRLVNALKLDTHRYPMFEPCYLRALCFHKLGKFDDAAKQYRTICENSRNHLLKERPELALTLCQKKTQICRMFFCISRAARANSWRERQ